MRPQDLVMKSPGAFSIGVLVSFVALIAAAPTSSMFHAAYDNWRPVIIKWRVTDARVDAADVVLSGEMVKQRDCAYVPPTVARDQDGQNYIVESNSRTAGVSWASSDKPQKWGPWTVRGAAGKTLEFSNFYICGDRKVIAYVGTYTP